MIEFYGLTEATSDIFIMVKPFKWIGFGIDKQHRRRGAAINRYFSDVIQCDDWSWHCDDAKWGKFIVNIGLMALQSEEVIET